MLTQQRLSCDTLRDEKNKLIYDFEMVNLYFIFTVQLRSQECVILAAFKLCKTFLSTGIAYQMLLSCNSNLQELKQKDEQYVKDLKKMEKEIDLLSDRNNEEVNLLTLSYRRELEQIEVTIMNVCFTSIASTNTWCENSLNV
jgi:hypothetical protein